MHTTQAAVIIAEVVLGGGRESPDAGAGCWVLVHEAVYDGFVAWLAAVAQHRTLGESLSDDVDRGPLVRSRVALGIYIASYTKKDRGVYDIYRFMNSPLFSGLFPP